MLPSSGKIFNRNQPVLGSGQLSLLEQILSSPETRPRAELLPIHPYFHNPESQTDVSLEELSELYFGSNQKVLRNAD
ncbi:hypothetical protein [Nostoc sp.]|uniref:hypothetical protein n=1 Tax=Nostoc sp. TaxID=1180 RepID=UPI002FFC3845